MLAGAERLRGLFRFFAATQCRGRSLVYETLSRGVADDDGLLGLLMRTPDEQRRPSLLFAAVNFLLASHPGAALAAYYPVHGGRRPVDSQLIPTFAAFCAEHADELGGLLRGRSTQRAWLAAFIWPEDTSGLATLQGAIDLVLSVGVPPVVPGDATTDIARLLAVLPGDGPVVVFTATLLSYLDASARAAFTAQLQEAARQRPIAWAFAEAPGFMAAVGLHIPALDGPLAQRNALSLAGVSLLGPDRRDDSLLALADPYLRWLAPARHDADDFEWLPKDLDSG